MAEIDFETVERLMEGEEPLEHLAPLQQEPEDGRRMPLALEAAFEKRKSDGMDRGEAQHGSWRLQGETRRRESSTERHGNRHEGKESRYPREKTEEMRIDKTRSQPVTPVFDDALRHDLTVLVLNLALKAEERAIYMFFSENAGRVRDIQVIRDGRSGRPKGVAYVEFYSQDAVIKALALSGHPICSQPIHVKASQAEKNRAARAAKQQQAEVAEGTVRLYVGNLVGKLAQIQEGDLKRMFSPFGEVMHVDMPSEPYNRQSKGYAFIQFRRATEGREAMMAMNNFEIGGVRIRVGFASDRPTHATGQYGAFSREAAAAQQLAMGHRPDIVEMDRLDEDADQGLLHDTSSKQALMRKLMRSEAPVGDFALMQIPPPIRTPAQPIQDRSQPYTYTPTSTPTSNLVLLNMFCPGDANGQRLPKFCDEILADVKDECTRFGTVVQSYIKRDKPDGRIWLRFSNVSQAQAAHKALHGRFFGGWMEAIKRS